MRAEIIDRLNLIVENDTNLRYNNEAIFTTFANSYPSSLDETKLPLVLWFPRQDSGYVRASSYNYRSVIEYDGMVYYDMYSQRLSTIQNIRVVKFPDLFANAFLSRPHLDYGDEGLNGVTGEITFRIISDIRRPLTYAGRSEPLYWGTVMRITIPYEVEIQLAT